MPVPRPAAILVDLDGTVIDTVDLLLASMRHAFTTCGLPAPPDEEWVAGIGTPLRPQFEAYTSDAAQVDALVAGFRAWQRAHHDEGTRIFPGMDDLVRRLHAAGHPLGVVTSKIDELAHRALAHVGIAECFPVVIGADTSRRHKPDPEPVRLALEALGAPAASTWFVGDSPHDITAGNAAGVRTVGVTWGPFSHVTLAHARAGCIVDSVEELERVVTGGLGTRD